MTRERLEEIAAEIQARFGARSDVLELFALARRGLEAEKGRTIGLPTNVSLAAENAALRRACELARDDLRGRCYWPSQDALRAALAAVGLPVEP